MRVVFSIVLMLVATVSVAQPKGTAPVIGQPLPDFEFNVKYVEPGVKKLSALKGKPVLLFFFAKGCVGSFHTMIKLSALYQQYKSKINFIAIAADHGDQIGESYERYRKHYKLNLPVAIDSVVYKKLGMYTFSTLILLDEAGIVQAVTYDLTVEAIANFLEGKKFFFNNTSDEANRNKYKTFDPRLPALVNGNGGPDSVFLQRSLISEWKPGMAITTLAPVYNHEDPFKNLQSINAVGRSLAELYRIAYFGRAMAWDPSDTVAYANFHFSPVLELRDSSLFDFDHVGGKNMFNYTQVLRPFMRTRENMMRSMQSDLKNCFGYEVTVETRMMPYLRLIAKPGAINRLKAVPGKTRSNANMVDGGDFYSRPMMQVLMFINATALLSSIDLPIVNETGFDGKIDFTMRGVMTSLEDVSRALRTQGLDIVRGEREMKVIVIRDAAKQLK